MKQESGRPISTIEEVERKQLYSVVTERVRVVLNERPVEVRDWFMISDGDLEEICNRMDEIRLGTLSLSAGIDKMFLHHFNADEKFFADHLPRMHARFDALMEQGGFGKFIEEEIRANNNFLKVMVVLHDFERFMINGPYGLPFIDGVGDAVMRKTFPGVPENYFHTIKMMTGEKELPEESGLVKLDVADKFALILKVVDSEGKPAATQQDLSEWAERQVEQNRFPFWVVKKYKRGAKRRFKVEAGDYLERDLECLRLGILVEEALISIHHQRVKERTEELLEEYVYDWKGNRVLLK